MRTNLIAALKATIALVLIVVVATAALQLYSSTKGGDNEEVYNLIKDAEMLHRRIEGSSLLEGFDELLATVTNEVPDDSSEVEVAILNMVLSAKGYTEGFVWLPPTTDTLDLLASLRREGQLLQSSYSKLGRAWSAKESGDESNQAQYCEEAKQFFEQAMSLRDQNTTYLRDQRLHIEHRTEQ